MVRVLSFGQGSLERVSKFKLNISPFLCLTGVLYSNRTAESPSYPSSPSSFSPPVKPMEPSPPSDSGYHGNSGGTGSAEDSDSGAQGIHLLLRPPDLLSPSLPPPLPPHTQHTLTPPPTWEQGPSLDEAWGSGDYLETLSFMVPDGEELALSTPLPNHPYDDDDGGDWVSYDTVFPARPNLPLSSRQPLSPSSYTPSIPLHTRPTHLDVFPTWDEDYDLEDMMPLEPTELLLPDMNSLEYYTNLLARERERERERDRERDWVSRTDSQPSITPTTTQTYRSPPPPSPSSGPNQGPKHPTAEPTPPLTVAPSLTAEEKSSTIKTPSTHSSSAPRPKDHAPVPDKHPGSPPSNTTGRVPPPPPLGPPNRPDKPDKPPLVIEKPEKALPTRTTTTSTTTAMTTTTVKTTTTQITAISLTRAPPVTTPRAATTRQYLCNVTKPEMYLVRVGKVM